jgi:hypothetical protein
MPYIKDFKQSRTETRRQALNPFTKVLEASDVGELNYQITCLARTFLRTHGTSYANINAVMGALECAKQEFYRRVAVPYEENKIKENGDVYL